MTDTTLWRPHLRGRPADGPGRELPRREDTLTSGAGTGVVLIRPEDQLLQDDIARIAVAAGIDMQIAGDAAEALRLQPQTVLLTPDFLHTAGHRSLAGLRGTETICVGPESAALWSDAARCGMDRVAALPAAGAWLAEHLARRNGPRGRVVGIAGTFGGAGGSTLACLLAQRAAQTGRGVLLADVDECGGGLEYRLGAEGIPGLRWPDLADVRGTLNPEQLVSALPDVGGFSLLTRPAGEPVQEGREAEVLPSVLEAARYAFDLTFLDLGTCPRPGSLVLGHCDALLVVLSGRTQLLLAARSWWASLQASAPDTFAVVRGPFGEGLDEVRVSDAAGIRLAGYLPCVRAVAAAEDRGRLLELRRRRFRRALARILDAVDPAPGDA